MSRFIFTDLATGNITATTTDASYPIANMSDYNPKNVWKSTAFTATLTVTVGDCWLMDWALFNCNVLGVNYRIYNGAALQESGTMSGDTRGNFWKDAGDDGPSTSIQFDINPTTVPASVGILRGGYATITGSPKSYSVGYEDFSLVDRTRNQALNIRQKEKIWSVSGSFDAAVDPIYGDTYVLIKAKDNSPYPIAIKILELPYKKFLFGQLDISQSGGIIYDGSAVVYSECSFDIREVL